MLVLLSFIQDEKARSKLEEIYHLYNKMMFYVAMDILKNSHEAEDTVQTALLKIANHLDKIKDVKCNKTKGFVVIIVRNIAIDTYNQKKKRSAVSYETLDDVIADETIENPEGYVLRLD